MMPQDSNRGNVDFYYRNFYSRMIGHDSDGILKILWKYPHRQQFSTFGISENLNDGSLYQHLMLTSVFVYNFKDCNKVFQ